MACIVTDQINCLISGLVTDINNSKDTAIWYKMQIKMNDICWQIERRYSDFEALHRKLVDSQGIPRDSIPPKKLIGNKDPEFVERRREKLDLYMKNVIQLLGKNPPDELANFLNLSEFEIIFMLRKLAFEIFEKGDSILENGETFTLSPYQIYAINERMKMPIPPLNSTDKRHDFSHIVDFCSNLVNLEIVGSNIPHGRSTVVSNDYSINFTPFKSVRTLILKNINFEKIEEIGSARRTVEQINVHNSNLSSTNQLLLSDSLYKSFDEAGDWFVWPKLKTLIMNNNTVQNVDDIGLLVPNLKYIDLNFNKLDDVLKMTSLPYLEHVSFAGNIIVTPTDLHLKLGNIKSLDLSHNQIEELSAFSKLYSLVTLNLSGNKISDVEQASNFSDLPCLEVLILTGNSVASSVDYRVKTLAYFGSRANDVFLDNEKASYMEMDQISILQAIELARKKTKPFP